MSIDEIKTEILKTEGVRVMSEEEMKNIARGREIDEMWARWRDPVRINEYLKEHHIAREGKGFVCELCNKFFDLSTGAHAHAKSYLHKEYPADSVEETQSKVCIKCGLMKPLRDYRKNEKIKSGFDNTCDLCCNAFSRINKDVKDNYSSTHSPEVVLGEYHRQIDEYVNVIRVENSLPPIERSATSTIKADADGKVNCFCGSRILKKGMKDHLKTFKHKAFIQSQA